MRHELLGSGHIMPRNAGCQTGKGNFVGLTNASETTPLCLSYLMKFNPFFGKTENPKNMMSAIHAHSLGIAYPANARYVNRLKSYPSVFYDSWTDTSISEIPHVPFFDTKATCFGLDQTDFPAILQYKSPYRSYC